MELLLILARRVQRVLRDVQDLLAHRVNPVMLVHRDIGVFLVLHSILERLALPVFKELLALPLRQAPQALQAIRVI
jgi:hypothetical protein